MMTDTRTAEQQLALDHIKDALRPHVDEMLREFTDLLEDVPANDLDREIDNLGHCLKLAFDQVAPHVSEPLRWSLPFGFTLLLREHMAPTAAVVSL